MRREIIAFCLLLTACATSGNPAIQYDVITSQIIIGKSTKADVRALLGNPTSTIRTTTNAKTSEIWAYGYASHQTSPWRAVPIVGLFAGGSQTESTGLSVSFTEDGIVQTMSRSQMNMKHGGLGGTTSFEHHTDTQSGTPPAATTIDITTGQPTR